MCVTLEPAKLSKTRIYSGEVLHPDGRPVHVIGYQNVVQARPGPNAMLLPFPAQRVGPENLVNGSGFAEIMAFYEQAVQVRHGARGVTPRSSMKSVSAEPYSVFDSGSYTIALATKASFLTEAIKEVPEARRPKIGSHFVVGLGQLYPNWPIAVCCFEGGDVAPEPLFWWYESRYPDVLFAPAIDAHDGNPPNPNDIVQRDHVVAFASHASKIHPHEYLEAAIERIVPAEHRWLFSARVVGDIFHGETRNGDFVCSARALRESAASAHRARTSVLAPPMGGSWGSGL